MEPQDLQKGVTYYHTEYGTYMKFLGVQNMCIMNAPDTQYVFLASFKDGEVIGNRYLVESSLKALEWEVKY